MPSFQADKVGLRSSIIICTPDHEYLLINLCEVYFCLKRCSKAQINLLLNFILSPAQLFNQNVSKCQC